MVDPARHEDTLTNDSNNFEGLVNIFVTGGAGYVGSILVPMLHERGHHVCAMDRLSCHAPFPDGVTVRIADLFDLRTDWLAGVDTVVHLAACSSDRSANEEEASAWRTNVAGSEHLIRACLKSGVNRFVYASTCSIYGHQPERISDETASPRLAGTYSESKYAVEVLLHSVTCPTFRPFILRKPTLFGWSPAMRTDVVVNSMVYGGLRDGVIRVHNAEVWRAVLHVRDAALAYMRACEAPIHLAGTYNIHFSNHRLIDIGCQVEEILRHFSRPAVLKIENRRMPISYRVTSDKFVSQLQFQPAFSLENGIREMLDITLNRVALLPSNGAGAVRASAQAAAASSLHRYSAENRK
jgi:nucleoside-diphosphate-sugar epimerase